MRPTRRAAMDRGRIFVRSATGMALIAAIVVPLAVASSLPIRTVRVSTAPDGTSANGSSANAVLSTSGRILVFDSAATNLADGDTNGAVNDVFALDVATNARRLVSAGGNGPSYTPTTSGNGGRIVFASDASNLVTGDTNGVTDLFLRDGGGPIVRITVNSSGAQANGPSYQPELSADGQFVVFASDASNLVDGDTNGVADVFVRNLATGEISRVSVSSSGKQGNGKSLQPSISADGTAVSFASAAANLVKGDTNHVPDVFVVGLEKETIARVSVSTSGKQQNKAVAAPFTQISDISENGRYIAFDSDATNLYSADTNKHTDVFVRDITTNTTTLVSASSFNVEGNNDSFAPRITPNGRYVSFQSFATNLAPGDGPREDIFLRDTRQGLTTVVNVTADGTARGPELVPQLLQRPAISNNGKTAAFSSTVANLTAGDANGVEDVFIRQMDAPVAEIVNGPRTAGGRVRLTVSADDPLARDFVCQVDAQTPFKCGPDINVKHNSGRTLRVRAGGLGTLFSDPLSVSITNDHKRPKVSVRKPTGKTLRVLRGRASDSSGISRVEVSFVGLVKAPTCRYMASATKFKKLPCALFQRAPFLRAKGKRNWQLRLPKTVKGPIVVRVRAYDVVGNVSKIGLLTAVVG